MGVTNAASHPPSPIPWSCLDADKLPAVQQLATQGAAVPKALPACVHGRLLSLFTPRGRSPGTRSLANMPQQGTAMCLPPAGKQCPPHVAKPFVKQPPGWPPDVWPPQGSMHSSQETAAQNPVYKNPPPWPPGIPLWKGQPHTHCRFGSRGGSGSQDIQDSRSSNQSNSPVHAGTGGPRGGGCSNSRSAGTYTSEDTQERTHLHLDHLRAAQGSATSFDPMSESGAPSPADTPSTRAVASASSVEASDGSRRVEEEAAARARLEEAASCQPVRSWARHSHVQISKGIARGCCYKFAAGSKQPRPVCSPHDITLHLRINRVTLQLMPFPWATVRWAKRVVRCC